MIRALPWAARAAYSSLQLVHTRPTWGMLLWHKRACYDDMTGEETSCFPVCKVATEQTETHQSLFGASWSATMLLAIVKYWLQLQYHTCCPRSFCCSFQSVPGPSCCQLFRWWLFAVGQIFALETAQSLALLAARLHVNTICIDHFSPVLLKAPLNGVRERCCVFLVWLFTLHLYIVRMLSLGYMSRRCVSIVLGESQWLLETTAGGVGSPGRLLVSLVLSQTSSKNTGTSRNLPGASRVSCWCR